jgi:hypothetical protein
MEIKRMGRFSKLAGALVLGISLAVAACNTPSATAPSTQETVTKAAASAEASLTIAAKGLTAAVNLGAIKPGSSTANAAKLALDSASKALDAAEAYIAAGLYPQAQAQIDNANKSAAGVDQQTGTADPTLSAGAPTNVQ